MLVSIASASVTVQVGKLGLLRLQPGVYAYVGSAFGPGGLQARVGRHLKLVKRPRWHIDYVRPFLTPTALFFTTDSVRREHEWAAVWQKHPDTAVPLPRFGASDCTCVTHFFYAPHQLPNLVLPSAHTQRLAL